MSLSVMLPGGGSTQSVMSNKAKLLLLMAIVVVVLAFLGYQLLRTNNVRSYDSDTTFTEQARVADFTENGVRVTVFAETDPNGELLLRATFSPTEPGFHVYSKDLDTKITDGIGMPTKLELLPNSTLKIAGPLFADRIPENHQGLGIYPDGPVSLRLPVQVVGSNKNVTAQIAISFMACKTDGICLRPVEREILDIRMESR